MNTIILFLCLCNMQDRGWCRQTNIQGEVPSYLAFYHRAPSQKRSTPVLKREQECKVDYDRKIEVTTLTPIIYR